MPIKEINAVLAPHGLTPPDLEMLRPTEQSYRCLLFQPSGPICATTTRIGCYDTGVAHSKARKFLELAAASGAHLATTPEYFFPWATLRESLLAPLAPASDALWVIGCESISAEGLQAFAQAVAERCLVIHEPVNGLPAQGSLLDPVVILFQAANTGGEQRLVAVVQFKTCPCRDELFEEEALLKRGFDIYRFRGASGHLAVATVICSDAFPLSNGLVSQLTDRATLIHIQLNPDPRNAAYRAYRAKTFLTDVKASDCHIVCLNWAHSIVQHGEAGDSSDAWGNIAGSTWYCSADGCSYADNVVLPNHSKGLYYAWLRHPERRHALLFHYDEAVFDLRVPKLMTIGFAVLANRNGPSIVNRYVWQNTNSVWNWSIDTAVPNSGFDALLQGFPEASAALQTVLAAGDALAVERVTALSAGAITGLDDWHAAKNIDSCQMDADEVVQRITVVQDMDPKAVNFRHYRLARTVNLQHEMATVPSWPPQIADVDSHATIQWNPNAPNFNVASHANRPALIVHLGESPLPRSLENVPDMLCDLLRRSGGAHSKRLCVVYRQNGELKFAPIPGLTRYDDGLNDPTDILSVQPLGG